jgi:Anti-sigma-K factor rskA/Sigma-70, region 4
MPRLDDLPPDLRATLSLLVDRGKSYAQVAELLGIPESAVRDRAHAALDALAGSPGGLGATPTSKPASPPGHLPDAPPASPARTPGPPVSRRGGALLLAGIAVVIVVVVVLVTSGGSSNNNSKSANTGTTTPTTSSTNTSTTSGASKATITNQIKLSPPEPSSKAIGIVEVLAEGSKRAFYLAAEHLPPTTNGSFYVIWLYNSPTDAEAISKTTVSSNGRTQGGALLPSNAGDYHQIIVTTETGEHATSPGPTVLSGPFSLTGS